MVFEVDIDLVKVCQVHIVLWYVWSRFVVTLEAPSGI